MLAANGCTFLPKFEVLAFLVNFGHFPKVIGNELKGVMSSQQLMGSKTKTNSSFNSLEPCQKVRNICKTFLAFLTDVFLQLQRETSARKPKLSWLY